MTTLTDSQEHQLPDLVQGDPVRYVGLVTRVASFVLDAAVITAVAILVGLGAVLVQGVLHLPSKVQTVIEAIGAAGYVLGTFGYFVAFWSATGQTPGGRVMQLRVLTPKGGRLKPRRGLVRCLGIILAALPLFLGFVPILFDRRRRGFQDWLAGSLVVDAPSSRRAPRSVKPFRTGASRSG